MGGSGTAGRGETPPARPARPRAGDPVELRHGPAGRHARPRARASGPASGGRARRTRARGAAPRDLPARVPRPDPGACRRRRVGRAGQGRRAPRRRPRQRRAATSGTRGENDDRAPPAGNAGTGRAQALAPGVDRAAVVGHLRRRDGLRPDGRRQRARRGRDPGQHAAHDRRGARAAAPGARGTGAPRGAGPRHPLRHVRVEGVGTRPADAAEPCRDGRLARARPGSRASACSTSAPPPAARPRISPR